MKKRIVVLTGVMASGKSSVAEALARRLDPAVHLRGDVFRRMVVSGRADMADPPSPEALRQLDLRHALTAQTAKTYWQAGFHVVAQDNFLGPKLAYFLDQLAGLPVRLFVLNPSPETIRRREAERPRKGYIGFTPEALHAVFLRETPRLGLWLDTSDWTVEDTATHILDRLRSEDGP